MGFWNRKEGRYRLFTDQERREFGQRKREEWHAKYITRSTLIRYNGWIDEAIAEFLKPVKAGPVTAYLRSAVAEVEQREDFRKWIADTKAARKALPRKRKPTDPNKPRFSKPLKVLPVKVEQGVSVYDVSCSLCRTNFIFIVIPLDVRRGVASGSRRCKVCNFDNEVRLSLNSETMRVLLPHKSHPPWVDPNLKTAQEHSDAELAAIDEELATLERKLEPIEQERAILKERYIELESRKFRLLKRSDSDRLRTESFRDWD